MLLAIPAPLELTVHPVRMVLRDHRESSVPLGLRAMSDLPVHKAMSVRLVRWGHRDFRETARLPVQLVLRVLPVTLDPLAPLGLLGLLVRQVPKGRSEIRDQKVLSVFKVLSVIKDQLVIKDLSVMQVRRVRQVQKVQSVLRDRWEPREIPVRRDQSEIQARRVLSVPPMQRPVLRVLPVLLVRKAPLVT